MKFLNDDAKILSSVEAENGAHEMIKKIRNEELTMDVLPNFYPKFTGELEEADYVGYNRFLSSRNGNMVINMLEEEDAREYIEL